jgi:mono/diheme cytochrome c family protein
MQQINHIIFSVFCAVLLPFFLLAPRPENKQIKVPTDIRVLALGKAMYHSACASCHGEDGKGDGPVAANLRNQPDDLTKADYDYRSTAEGQLPTDYDLYRTITSGIHNSAMPFFRQMSSDDRWAIVQYVKSLSPKFSDSGGSEPLEVVNYGRPILSSPQSLAKGRKVYVQAKCANCHGENGLGDGPLATRDVDKRGRQIEAMDLTNYSEYKYCRSTSDIFRILYTGLSGSHMPSYAANLSEEERWHLSNYIWSLQNCDQYRDSK